MAVLKTRKFVGDYFCLDAWGSKNYHNIGFLTWISKLIVYKYLVIMFSCVLKYKDDFLLLILSTLLLSFSSALENGEIAEIAFVTSFFHSLAWSILILWVVRDYKYIKRFYFLFLFFLFFLDTSIYFLFGSRFDSNIFTLVMQTDFEESKEFFITYLMTWKCLVCLILFISMGSAILYWTDSRSIRNVLKNKVFRLLAVFFLIIGFSLPYFVSVGNNTVVGIYKAYVWVINQHSDIENFEKCIDRIIVYKDSCEVNPPTIVFVLGESFNKHHSQLYGYNLPTSPKLSLESNLVVFTHAQSPVCYTSGAMRYIFTLKSCQIKNDTLLQYVLFPAIFKKASFKVAYFDNQFTRSRSGAEDLGCNYFFSPKYVNENCFDIRNNNIEKYDGDFIENYKSKFIKGGKALNIIHLKGQHIEAYKRYPHSFSIFKADDVKRKDLTYSEREIVANYDNATLYNDYVIHKIIDIFRNEDAVLVYLSDHGDNIYDGKMHRYGRRPAELYDNESLYNIRQIPFMIWCSDSFILKRPYLYERIKKQADTPVCSDDIAYCLFEFAGIHSNFQNSSRSIISPTYQPHISQIE